jgi:SAM-dependent methyltransferase
VNRLTEHGLEALAAFRSLEHHGWQELADSYGQYFGTLVSQAIGPLLDAASVAAGRRVLDLCCGPGFVSAAVRDRGAIPTGVDFSSHMVGLSRRQWPTLDFREGDAEDLEFPDSTFDAVVMNFGMLHVSRPDAVVREAARVLRKDGWFAFTVWDKPGLNVGHQIIFNAMQANAKMDVGLPEAPPMFRFSDSEECEKLIRAAGLGNATTRVLRHTWTLPGPDGLFDAFRAGGVRVSMTLNRQTDQATAAVKSAVREACAPYAKDGRLYIPMASVLTAAQRMH